MNLIVASPKSTSFLGLASRILGYLSRVPMVLPRRRYVNIGEFSPHLQRDMGFLDGRRAPGSECGPDAPGLATRDWTK